MIEAIIVEDEFNALNTLDKLIRYTQKDIEVVAKIDNVEEAISFLKKRTPDLVFLDIELIGGQCLPNFGGLGQYRLQTYFYNRLRRIRHKGHQVRYDRLFAKTHRFRRTFRLFGSL